MLAFVAIILFVLIITSPVIVRLISKKALAECNRDEYFKQLLKHEYQLRVESHECMTCRRRPIGAFTCRTCKTNAGNKPFYEPIPFEQFCEEAIK